MRERAHLRARRNAISYGIQVPCILRYPPRTRRSCAARSGWESMIFTMSAIGIGRSQHRALDDKRIRSGQRTFGITERCGAGETARRQCDCRKAQTGGGAPFQMPVQSTYPSSMSSMIHCPFSGYSYTGLPAM